MKRFFLLLCAFTLVQKPVFAGNLDNAVPPTTAGSAMPTLTDIYNRLATGATITIPGTFQEPVAGPAGSGKTLAEIQVKLPVADNVSGAVVGEVLTGKKFWGLRTDGTWGIKIGTLVQPLTPTGDALNTDVLFGKIFSNADGVGISGTMPNRGDVSITPRSTDQKIPDGYHNGSGVVKGDANLKAANIRSGITVFGVTGSFYGQYSCSTGDESPLGRWCNNGNGTVLDMTTGLVWLRDAIWGGQYPFWAASARDTNAHDRAAQVKHGNPASLTDGSVEGSWRLPTKIELISLTTGIEPVSDSAMYRFLNVQPVSYWSSSTSVSYNYNAWVVYMGGGEGYGIGYGYKTASYIYVWPVRGGQ